MALRCLLGLGLCLLVAGPGLRAEPKDKRLLLIGQPPDGHPPTTHEYLPGLRIVARLLDEVPGLQTQLVNAAEPWPEGPQRIREADGVVIFLAEGAKWTQADPRRFDALTALAARGGGIAALHWGTGARDARYVENFLKLAGACHGGPDRRYQVLTADVSVVAPQHPIRSGVRGFRVHDEFYYRLKQVGPPGSIEPLLQVPIEGEPQTVCWAWERPDGGRSFGFTGLHFHENWRLSQYRRLVAQGILWTLKLPIPPEGLPVDLPEKELDLRPAATR